MTTGAAPSVGLVTQSGDPLRQDPAHAAFFASLRHASDEPVVTTKVVPYSLRAALLAGIVVGCGLAGLDITGLGRTLGPIAQRLHLDDGGAMAMPVLLMLGLFGGARAVASTLLLAHALLRRLGWTSRSAYAVAGALAALIPTLLCALVADTSTAHGWVIDALAGATGGFLYRVFAGTRSA